MANELLPFCPGANTTISATTSSAAAVVSGHTMGPVQVRLYNAASVVVFVKAGDSTVTATTSDYPLVAGAVEVITLKPNATGAPIYLAGITSSGSGTVYVSSGVGV